MEKYTIMVKRFHIGEAHCMIVFETFQIYVVCCFILVAHFLFIVKVDIFGHLPGSQVLLPSRSSMTF